ncbi:Glutamyl-tRNA synthetase, partial [Aspergillus sclerotialis]
MQEEDELENVLNAKTEFRDDAVADHNVAELQVGDIIQFDRKGYYRVDRAYSPDQPAILFNIPTGKA